MSSNNEGIVNLNAEIEQRVSKRELQKEARRNEIIDAAFAEFTSRGFTSTRLDDVAERAGIGKGTIYLYFDSKESLFEEVVRQNLFPARDAAANLVAEFTGSASELLTLHLQNFYSLLKNEKVPPLMAMVIGEANRFPKLTDFIFREMISKNQEIMKSIIRRGIESGEFRETNIVTYTQILIAPAVISAIWKLQFETILPIDLDEFAQTHIDIILNGLKQ